MALELNYVDNYVTWFKARGKRHEVVLATKITGPG